MSLTRAQFVRGNWKNQPMVASGNALARVSSRCLARHGVFCRTCGESCGPDAIKLQPIVGGVPQPQIDPERCTGCGDCLASCPAQAIVLKQRDSEGDLV